tara:strand:+ start:17 stop:517 length:501 start_codon:yes stop_codon:yes gene_type:complete
MADIKIDSTDSTKINIEVADSNDLNLELTGGDKGLRTHMLETIYPVGSIYINAGVATNPGTLLGFGTWSAFGTGRTIVGVDSSDTDFDAVRETGGSKTHTLTIAELPSHTHQTTLRGNGEDENLDLPSASDNSDPSRTMTSGATGGGGAHNNLQPYITAYMWRRTA